MSEESVGAEEQFDLTYYIDCPVCNAPLSNSDRSEVEAHLTSHFADKIKEKISEASDPLGDGSFDACPECDETPSDPTLHFGVAHGATAELVVDHVKSLRSTREISLPLNFEKVCRICGMDFGLKQVDPPGKRKHLLTHHNYRRDILDAVGKYAKSGNFYLCPEHGCGFATKSRSILTDSHLAVYHQYLQKLYDGEKLEPKRKPPTAPVTPPPDQRPGDSSKEVKATKSPWSIDSPRPTFGYQVFNIENFQSAPQNGHDDIKRMPEKKKLNYFEYRQKEGFVKSEKQPIIQCDNEPVPADDAVQINLEGNPKLPVDPPHICPVCLGESSSYERLKNHYESEHKKVQAYGGSKSNSEVDAKCKVEPTSPEEDVLKAKATELFAQQMSELENAVELEDDTDDDFALPMQQLKEDPRNVAALKKVVPQMSTDVLSENIYPGVELRWLCDGKLLLLEHQKSPEAFKVFQDQWLRGQPVVIANSGKYLNPDLWTPESFSRDFGKVRHTLVNCLKGTTVPNAKLRVFWDGFQHVTKRLKDEQGTPMLLKLKDWPPTDDLAEFMPDRFNDLMRSLPMPEYTLRSGRLNIAGYIPDYFLKPELGPKMYIAYGSALYPQKGSTNLHIDMSDAVNALVYVGLPKDGDDTENINEVFKEVDKAGRCLLFCCYESLPPLSCSLFLGCDVLMKNRVHDPNCKPGALWHIFHPGDTPKIRDLLKKVALENGKRLDPHDDPIHDQSTYLDGELRMRLYKEYGVHGKCVNSHHSL